MNNSAQLTPLHRERVAERQRRSRRKKRQYRLYPVLQVLKTVSKGLDHDLVLKTPVRSEWDVAGRCTDPQPVCMDGSPAKLRGEFFRRKLDSGRVHSLTLYTACRRCAACLRQRRNLWARRASEEMKVSARTWFATFTWSPQNHVLMTIRASARLRARGVNYEALPGDDKGAERAAEYRRELTLYFKRLRKNTGANLRYILVEESHKSGLPHYHALIHEVDSLAPVRHAQLTANFTMGFTRFKLVNDPRSAWYVAKYLAKDAQARVRASVRYGQGNTPLRHREATPPREHSPAKSVETK